MACSDYNQLREILQETEGAWPIDAVWCTFASDLGAGIGSAVFALAVLGPLGLGIAIRNNHPAPLIVVSILSAGLFASALPGMAAKVLAVVLFLAISAIGLIIWQRAQTSL